jgi:hypothetical protein
MTMSDGHATPERAAELTEAIRRIWTAQVYQDRDMHKGISLEMVAAIRRAAQVAGLTGPTNPWLGLGMLEDPDPEAVRRWREWQETEDTRS